MPLFKNGAFVEDDWRLLAQGEDLPASGKIVLTLAQWQAFKEAQQGAQPLGLFLEPKDDPQTIAAELPRFSLIIIHFPKFTDGRGYSLARKLRGHYGFAGEIRATGDILFDQLQLLLRCGFDTFEIKDPVTIKLLEEGRRPDFRLFYQPGVGPEVPDGTRRWGRRAAG
jgi:phosphoadenosine phosphosulfate reductase